MISYRIKISKCALYLIDLMGKYCFVLSKKSVSALIRGCEIFPYFFPSVLGWRYALIDLTLNLRCEKDWIKPKFKRKLKNILFINEIFYAFITIGAQQKNGFKPSTDYVTSLFWKLVLRSSNFFLQLLLLVIDLFLLKLDLI